jgi:hypothetical protein
MTVMTKHSVFTRSTLATLLVLAVTPVAAADPDIPARGPLPFSGVDADGNGQVSQEEFNRAHTERLQQRSQSENQYRYMGNAPAFSDIDRNADGGLSRDEFQYQQRHQQMYQERMNTGVPGGMGQGRGGGRR